MFWHDPCIAILRYGSLELIRRVVEELFDAVHCRDKLAPVNIFFDLQVALTSK